MLQSLLGFKETPEFLDATDGLAAAYCHFIQNSNVLATVSNTTKPKTTRKKVSSWEAYVNSNPDKIKKS
jgi:crossover junction endodeoxyribonuclease RuvC